MVSKIMAEAGATGNQLARLTPKPAPVANKKVRTGFLEQAKNKDNWEVLSAEQSQADLANNIWALVQNKMEIK